MDERVKRERQTQLTQHTLIIILSSGIIVEASLLPIFWSGRKENSPVQADVEEERHLRISHNEMCALP